MELLLHFTLPFVALTLLGVKPRRAFPLAVLAVLPDLDALFLVHRSLTHSLITVGIVVLPLLMFCWRFKPRHIRVVLLGLLSIASHMLLDVFSGYTPVLWPLYPYSICVRMGLNSRIGSGVTLHPVFEFSQVPTIFYGRVVFDAPIFTSEGLVASLMLMLPIIYMILKRQERV